MGPRGVVGESRAVTIIPAVVREHVEEVAFLHTLRTSLTRAPHVKLRDVAGFDERLAAHHDGLSVAGEYGWLFCDVALETPSSGTVFTSAVRAIEEKQQQRIDRCLALAHAVPESRPGLTSAFGWLGGEHLEGVVASLLGSSDPFRRMIGVTACALHRVDPGLVSARRILDASSAVRARALRTAGEIGCDDARAVCVAGSRDDDPECGLWAAWSSVLLGHRGEALDRLTEAGLAIGPHRARAYRLALQAMNASAAHEVLRGLAKTPEQLRWLIQGTGVAGDPVYSAWLIGQMADAKIALT